MCVPSLALAPQYVMSEICPSTVRFPPSTSCFVVMSYVNTFIVALAYTLILMCCIIVLIFPEWQIMSAFYLRGFLAVVSSFLTVLLNLIRANPDVLVRKKQGPADNNISEESFTL